MNAGALVWIAIGGAAGSVARAVVAAALPSRPLWATLAVNVAGSLLLGWFVARMAALEPPAAARLHALLAVGFCGGFTTFSTFSLQTLEQLLKGQWTAAAMNVLLSVSLCLVGVWVGFRLGRA